MSQAEYDAQTWPVPRFLIESAIDALYELSQSESHWRGIRDYRIDLPTQDAEALRAIVGEYAPVLSPEEEAAREAIFQKTMDDMWQRIAARKERGDGRSS